jgi:hypothetical protein
MFEAVRFDGLLFIFTEFSSFGRFQYMPWGGGNRIKHVGLWWVLVMLVYRSNKNCACSESGHQIPSKPWPLLHVLFSNERLSSWMTARNFGWFQWLDLLFLIQWAAASELGPETEHSDWRFLQFQLAVWRRSTLYRPLSFPLPSFLVL